MDLTMMKHRVLITYRRNSPELYERMEQLGTVTRNFTHIRCFVLSCDPDLGDAIFHELQAHPDVERVEFDSDPQIKPRFIPSDDAMRVFSNHKIYEAVRAYEAWDIQKGRPDVIGAVSDTGADPDHAEIKDSLILPGYLPGINNFVPGLTVLADKIGINPYTYYTQKVGYAGNTVLNKNCWFLENPWLHHAGESVTDAPLLSGSVFLDEACTIPAPQPVVITTTLTVWVRQAFALKVETSPGTFPMQYDIGDRLMYDSGGHGTAVVSIAVGAHGTGEGAQGIVPGCKVVPMNVIGKYASVQSWQDVIDSFLFVETSGAVAVNCSWGTDANSAVPQAAIDSVTHAVNAGVIVVVASGNYAIDDNSLDVLTFPCTVPGVLNVSGTGFFGDYSKKTFFAVRGDRVFMSAPCTDFLTALPGNPNRQFNSFWSTKDSLTVLNPTITEWQTSGMDGTSFAAPLVYSAVLGMFSEAKDQGRTLNKAQIEQYLRESVDPCIGSALNGTTFDTTTLNGYGYPVDGMGFGTLDIARAYRAVQQGIDVRAKKLAPLTVKSGVATSFKVDVRTWGSGIQKIEAFVDGGVVQTLTPGGTSYVATFTYTFPAEGMKSVHFVATDLNGSVSTTPAISVTVESVVKPVLSAKTYPLSGDFIGYLYHSNNGDHVFPIVVYSDKTINVVMESTAGQSLTLQTLTAHIDGVLHSSINVSGYAPSTTPRTLTLNGAASITPGFHTLTLTLTGGGNSDSKTYQMVYSPNTTAPVIYTAPYRYRDGVLTVPVYLAGDIHDTNGTGMDYVDRVSIAEIVFYIDGHPWYKETFLAKCRDAYLELRARIPVPDAISVQGKFFRMTVYYYDPDAWDSDYMNPTYVTQTITVADSGNTVSIDSNPPVTFATRGSGTLAEGTTIELKTFWPSTPDNTTMYYKWDDDPAYSTYSAPIAVRTGTLQWYGEDAAGNAESVQSATYTAALPPPGSIDAPSVQLRPVVAAPSLSGSVVSIGSISTASVSLRPSVSPATLSGVQVGSMSVPAVTLRPSVAVGTLTGVEASVGSIAAASTTMQIQVNPPTLRGVTAGTAIRAPDGTSLDLRDIYGAPLDIRAVA